MSRDDLDAVNVLTERIDNLIERLDRFEERTVTQHEFWPVRTIVYGGAGIVLMGIASAIVALVLKS